MLKAYLSIGLATLVVFYTLVLILFSGIIVITPDFQAVDREVQDRLF